MKDINPAWAKAMFFFWMVLLSMTTFVVVVNLWGLTVGIPYSLPGLLIFTGLSIAIIIPLTKCQRIAWPKDDDFPQTRRYS